MPASQEIIRSERRTGISRNRPAMKQPEAYHSERILLRVRDLIGWHSDYDSTRHWIGTLRATARCNNSGVAGDQALVSILLRRSEEVAGLTRSVMPATSRYTANFILFGRGSDSNLQSRVTHASQQVWDRREGRTSRRYSVLKRLPRHSSISLP